MDSYIYLFLSVCLRESMYTSRMDARALTGCTRAHCSRTCAHRQTCTHAQTLLKHTHTHTHQARRLRLRACCCTPWPKRPARRKPRHTKLGALNHLAPLSTRQQAQKCLPHTSQIQALPTSWVLSSARVYRECLCEAETKMLRSGADCCLRCCVVLCGC